MFWLTFIPAGSAVKSSITNSLNPDTMHSDLEKLSESFKLLKDTTNQVASEANATAVYLKEKLHDTTFRFFSVIDSVDDLVVIKDANGKWKTMNKFGQQLYSMSPEDYHGKTDLELAEIFPHHAKGLTYCNFTDQKAWKSRKSHREIESFDIDDRTHYFDVIKTPVYYANGQKKELIIIGRDVTGLVEAQERANACYGALNEASDNILIMDSQGKITFCNDSLLHTFGFKQHDDLEGHYISLLVFDRTNQTTYDEMWKTIVTNNYWIGVMSFRHKQGPCFQGQISVLPVMNGHVEPIYYICVIKTCLEVPKNNTCVC